MLRFVGIGLLLLGVLGAAIGTWGWFTAGRIGGEVRGTIVSDWAGQLRAADVPETLVVRFENNLRIDDVQRKPLTHGQARLLQQAELIVAALPDATDRAVRGARRRNGVIVGGSVVLVGLGGWLALRRRTAARDEG